MWSSMIIQSSMSVDCCLMAEMREYDSPIIAISKFRKISWTMMVARMNMTQTAVASSAE